MKRSSTLTEKRSNIITAILFILPFGILYTVFTIWPVVQGFYVSLHKWGLMGKLGFEGFDNYEKMIGDRHFWSSLRNSSIFVLISVPLLTITALMTAVIADYPSKLRKLFRTSFYLPSVLSVSVISFVTLYMASPTLGFINQLLHTMGMPAGVEPLWLSDQNLVWFTIAIATVWWTVGFSMLLYLAALQDIPRQVYESASIDGASGIRQFFSITLPLLKPTTYLIVLLQIIASYKVFGQIKMITGGGPGTYTRPIIQYIYVTAFEKNNMGYAAAMSYALFLILVVLTIIQLKLQNKEGR